MDKEEHKFITLILSLIILGIYFYYGMMFLAILAHEESHVHDVRNGVLVSNERINIYLMPKNENLSGAYKYSYSIEDSSKIEDIKLFTESKASFLEYMVFFAGLYSFISICLFLRNSIYNTFQISYARTS